MYLYRTPSGPMIRTRDTRRLLQGVAWDDLFRGPDVAGRLARLAAAAPDAQEALLGKAAGLPPIGGQEIWAAGVTYTRSRAARMQESAGTGAASFYDRVYGAERPELFFKSTPHRAVGPGGVLRLRGDSTWMVPEPELTLAISDRGEIFGYTIGNDLSCRDIEGENPLYLPQAKIFDGCVALGPAILIRAEPLPPETAIRLEIRRDGVAIFTGDVTLARMKRSPQELVSWLFRASTFPAGVLLLTGTGIVPPDDLTLAAGDEVRIEIDGLGVLTNPVDLQRESEV